MYKVCEDRFFLGPPHLILPLRFLANDTSYLFAPFRIDDNLAMHNSNIKYHRSFGSNSDVISGEDRQQFGGITPPSKSYYSSLISDDTSSINFGARSADIVSGSSSVASKGKEIGPSFDVGSPNSRASILALLQPAKFFSPEALLYEYLSALTAYHGAHVCHISNFLCCLCWYYVC